MAVNMAKRKSIKSRTPTRSGRTSSSNTTPSSARAVIDLDIMAPVIAFIVKGAKPSICVHESMELIVAAFEEGLSFEDAVTLGQMLGETKHTENDMLQ